MVAARFSCCQDAPRGLNCQRSKRRQRPLSVQMLALHMQSPEHL